MTADEIDKRAELIMASVRALPVDPDGRTPEEDAIFEQIEADVRSGAPGLTTEALAEFIGAC